MKKIFFLAFFLVSSCTNKYGNYNPFNGGYSEKEIKENIYLVGYESKRLSDDTKTINLALLRASEIAIKKNKDYFEAHPSQLKSLRRISRQFKNNIVEEISREAKILVNINPKKVNSEITFNSRELCSLIMSLEYDEEWFDQRIDCETNLKTDQKKTEEKLKSYHKNFNAIIKGDYLPK